MKIRLTALFSALLLSALWLQGCPSNSNSPAAPAPVTIVELVTATFTHTPSVSPTVTPSGTPTATPGPAPVVMNGYFSTNEDAPLTLSNATLNSLVVSSISGDTLNFLYPGSPGHGTLSPIHSGSTNTVTYTPANGFYGTDSFAYEVYDQVTQQYSRVQTMVITVVELPTSTPTLTATLTPTSTVTDTPTVTPTPVPAPVIANAYFTTSENMALSVSSSTIQTFVVSDPNNDPLVFTAYGTPASGTLAFNPDGSFIYTPNANFTGSDYFYFYVTDEVTNEISDGKTIVITVN